MWRFFEGVLLLAFLIAVIWAALEFVAPITIVNNNKEFAGALVAAAGTIFAGWLAWSAVREQIDFSREQLAVQQKQTQFWEKQNLKTEIVAIQNAIAYVEKLDAATNQVNAEPRPYFSALRRLNASGKLISFMGNTPSGELGTRVQQIQQRLAIIVNQGSNWIQRREQVDASLKAGATGVFVPPDSEMEQYEAAAKDAAEELHQLHQDLMGALKDRETKFAAMP